MAFVLCHHCGKKINHKYMSQIKNRRFCNQRCRAAYWAPKRRVLVRKNDKRLYHVWRLMIARCHNPQSKDFSRYGRRGIKVCRPWRNNFDTFEIWALTHGRFRPDLLLERKDNEKGYSPHNCKFATPREQARNRRDNLMVTAFGETKTAVEWSEDPRCKPSYQALMKRLRKQLLPPEVAITHPVQPFGSRHKI